ncbi:50S ribosomal protein L24 [Candidatus Binatia bacterium]|nr:50S ribosomal protein L24 [Candidatus Binatia bacterium]
MRATIRKNDTVMVIAGRDRGKTGKVLRVFPERERVTVERLNMVKRHSKARGPQTAAGIVEKEAPIHRSNLMIMCDKCNAPVRMGKRRLEDGRSVRVCRACNEQLDR